MEHRDEIFEECEWCGKPICYGNALVVVSRSIEQVDRDDNPSGSVITVIWSEPLLTVCAECGNRIDDVVLRGTLRQAFHEGMKALR